MTLIKTYPQNWTDSPSQPLREAIGHYQNWLADRSVNPNLETQYTTVMLLRIYLVDWLSATCWGEGTAIVRLRAIANKIETIKAVGELHRILNLHGFEPIDL